MPLSEEQITGVTLRICGFKFKVSIIPKESMIQFFVILLRHVVGSLATKLVSKLQQNLCFSEHVFYSFSHVQYHP